jgi:hypothetical protein
MHVAAGEEWWPVQLAVHVVQFNHLEERTPNPPFGCFGLSSF